MSQYHHSAQPPHPPQVYTMAAHQGHTHQNHQHQQQQHGVVSVHANASFASADGLVSFCEYPSAPPVMADQQHQYQQHYQQGSPHHGQFAHHSKRRGYGGGAVSGSVSSPPYNARDALHARSGSVLNQSVTSYGPRGAAAAGAGPGTPSALRRQHHNPYLSSSTTAASPLTSPLAASPVAASPLPHAAAAAGAAATATAARYFDAAAAAASNAAAAARAAATAAAAAAAANMAERQMPQMPPQPPPASWLGPAIMTATNNVASSAREFLHNVRSRRVM
jgi:hypothetical protein